MIVFNLKYTVELMIAEFLFIRERKKRSYFPLRVFASLLICIIGSLILNFERTKQTMPQFCPLGGVLRYLIIVALTIAAMAITFEIEPYQLFMYAICAYTVQHTAYSLHELLMLLTSIFGYDSDASQLDFVYWFSYAVIYALVYTVLDKTNIKPLRSETSVVSFWTIMVLSGGVLLNILVFSLSTYHFDTFQLVLFRLLSVTTCLLALTVMKKLVETQGLKRDMAFLSQMASLKESHYETLKESIAATNLRCHDFKHQLAVLRVKNRTAELSGTLEDLEHYIAVYDSIAQTGNEALDVVLTEKSTICRMNGIRLTYMADSEKVSALEDRDIYNLFGNMLDNAIEATKKLSGPDRRVIKLSAAGKGELMSIQIVNYCDKPLVMEDGLIPSTKPDPLFHGYGLRSIKMIAEKYGGTMSIDMADGLFELNILIPINL